MTVVHTYTAEDIARAAEIRDGLFSAMSDPVRAAIMLVLGTSDRSGPGYEVQEIVGTGGFGRLRARLIIDAFDAPEYAES